jgi:hypothetical protein
MKLLKVENKELR